MSLGFIILRHVRDEKSSKYWILSLEGVKKHYPECLVMIVDDHSDYKYIDEDYEKSLKNIVIVKSELPPGRGEYLPYYYYVRNKIADNVCFIHDSVFINKRVDLPIVETYSMLWTFNSEMHTNIWTEILLLGNLKNISLDMKELYLNKEKWVGCFGCMTIISHKFLEKIYNKYNLDSLKNIIKSRSQREAFERILGLLLQSESGLSDTIFGDIFKYCKNGTTFEEIDASLPFSKVWTGR